MANISKKTKRKLAKIKKAVRQARRNDEKYRYEKKRQAELGAKKFGHWKFPIYGVSTAEVYERSEFYGDWIRGEEITGKHIFHIDVLLVDTVKKREFFASYTTEPCYFQQIYGVVVDHLDEIYLENPELEPCGWHSRAIVRM